MNRILGLVFPSHVANVGHIERENARLVAETEQFRAENIRLACENVRMQARLDEFVRDAIEDDRLSRRRVRPVLRVVGGRDA